MDDKLIVEGLGKQLDGEYPFSLVDLISRGRPESMTNGELHRVKMISGVLADDIQEAFFSGDNDVVVALSSVILTRAGKYVDDEQLWNAQPASLVWDIEILRKADEPSPPEIPATTPEQQTPSPSGGPSSDSTSENPASDQSPTIDHDSERSATSSHLRSVV